MLKIGIIVGSTRPTRVGRTIAEWALDNLQNDPDVSYELIDLKEENLPFLDEPQSPSTGQYEKESTKQWSKKIAELDGYIWITSEYNHGYPAPLKNAIDTLYHEWTKKPVAFVGYGGMGGARAIEQLAQVAAQLGAMPLSGTGSTVRVIDVWSAAGENGNINPAYVRGSFEALSENLKWWTKVLKEARTSALAVG